MEKIKAYYHRSELMENPTCKCKTGNQTEHIIHDRNTLREREGEGEGGREREREREREGGN